MGPWVNFDLVYVFVNKVLVANSHVLSLHIVCDHFHALIVVATETI